MRQDPAIDGRRPSIDVVVPFHGSDAALGTLIRRLSAMQTGPEDTVTVVDNRAGAASVWREAGIAVVPAPAEQSSYHARNVGAREGVNPWILFIDADVLPPPDLADQYFREPVGERVAVVAGSIRDARAERHEGIAARYAYLEQTLAHENVLGGRYRYAATANVLVRREAFTQVGGFTEGIRSGGDADLCFRLDDAGWMLEARPAAVEHQGRATVRKLLRQYLRYGAGAAWLDERRPGFLDVWPWRALVIASLRGAATAAIHLSRGRRDAAIVATLRPLTRACFRIGSLLPNAAVPTGALVRGAIKRRARAAA